MDLRPAQHDRSSRTHHQLSLRERRRGGRPVPWTQLGQRPTWHALGRLIAEEPARLAALQPALDRLVEDPQQEVRAATAGALAPILYTNADLAIGLFNRAVADSTDELLRSGYVEHFLRHAIRCSRYTDIAPLVARMTGSADEEARRVGARQLALASFHDPELDPAVDVLLDGADEMTRASAVSVFADSITYAPRRDRSTFVISAAFSDPARTVRDEAERAFYELADERLGDYRALLRSFADSPAMADGAGAVLHSIEGSRHPLPPEALDLCEASVSVHRNAVGDISTRAGGDATYGVRLALRPHAQHADPAIRSRCLDLISLSSTPTASNRTSIRSSDDLAGVRRRQPSFERLTERGGINPPTIFRRLGLARAIGEYAQLG